MTTTRAPCPQCERGPRDTALAITIDERGTVSFCHRCGYTATEHTARAASYVPRTTAKPEPLDWSPGAESTWRRTQPLKGTLGEVYLHHRGCILPPRDSHLRFLSGDDRYPPSLVAAITDIRTAKPISLHFTRLAADGKGKAGTDRDKVLLAGHRKRGGCIRLWPDEAVTHGLALAEGIESALSAAHAFTPTWATVDAAGMAAFPVLPGIEALVLFADGDDAGIDAAAECADRWTTAGKDVLVTFPSALGTDMNDEVRA